MILDNKRLKTKYVSEYNDLKVKKVEVDRNLKVAMGSYKLAKKKLTDLRIEREKFKHPDWYNEKSDARLIVIEEEVDNLSPKKEPN